MVKAIDLDKAQSPSPMTQAEILSEALPFMQRYDHKFVVIKYGGHAMGDKKLSRQFAKDIVLLKQSGVHPIVVHGGGPQIGAMLEKLNIKSDFKNGLRVTNEETIDVVEMILSGVINKGIVAAINAEGGKACGISGKDGQLMTADKYQGADLGFVGQPKDVDPQIIDVLVQSDFIPVVAPVAACPSGETYNINADTFAGALATSLKAKRLLLLTDVPGVLDKKNRLIQELTTTEAKELIVDETISGGMIPKIESCINVVENGVEGVVIVDGRVPHAVLLELFTAHGAGTLLEAKTAN